MTRLTPSDVFQRLDQELAPSARADVLLNGSRDDGEAPLLVVLIHDTPVQIHGTHPFWAPFMATLRQHLLAADCDLLISSRAPSPASLDPFGIERWRRLGVDALIVSECPGVDPTDLLESELPICFLEADRIGQRAGYVMVNNLDGTARAVRHLYTLGRRRIAYIAGTDERAARDRLLGYRSELARLALDEREEYVIEGDYLHRSGYEAAKRFLALPEPPDAIVAASDMMAVGAMLAVQHAGLRVPEDVAVIGFDDNEFAEQLNPALTTVRQDAGALAHAVADAVVGMLRRPNESPPAILLPTDLIVRESCGAALARQAATTRALGTVAADRLAG